MRRNVRHKENMKSLFKNCLLIAGGIILISLFFLPSIISLKEGRLKYQTVFESVSPDGKHMLTISKRDAFPVNELFDPSTVVRIELSGASKSVQKFKLREDSDLITEPEVIWDNDTVFIPKLSTGRKPMIDFKMNIKEGRTSASTLSLATPRSG